MISFFRSMQGRLFGLIFMSVALLFTVLAVSSYYQFKKIIFDAVDHTLHSKMQMVKGLMHEEHGEIEFEVEEIALGEYTVPRSGHYYQIYMAGEAVAASDSLVDVQFNLAAGELEFHDMAAREWIYAAIGPAGEPIRTIRHDFEFMDSPITLYIAESLTESLAMLKRVRIYFAVILPLLILAVALAGVVIAKHSLQPLKLFAARIRGITHKTLNERVTAEGQVAELQGLTDDFNCLLARLEEAFATEKRLLSDAAHELKTPLTVIQTQCDVTLLRERDSREYIEALAAVKGVTAAMRRLVTDMLSLARVDAGTLVAARYDKVSLAACLEEAMILVDVLARKQDIAISVDMPADAEVWGDGAALTEALVNLIENAIRYNKIGGSVIVALRQVAGQVRLTVKDSGIGISEAEAARIFDRFYRSSATRNMEGTGLGLSIVQAIIQAHKGQIYLQRQNGSGSCFEIRLPIYPGNQPSVCP